MKQRRLVGKAATIRDAVCDYFGIMFSEITEQDRTLEVSYIRHLLVFLLTRHTKMEYLSIARAIKRDRTTVYNCVKRMKNRIDTCDVGRRDLKILTEKIEGCLHT